ncbi:unnamed protein product, partial [Sphagnum compactum]
DDNDNDYDTNFDDSELVPIDKCRLDKMKNANVKSNLQTLQAKQEEMLERISRLEDNQERVKKIISLLQSEIEGIGYQVKGITDSLKLLQSNLPSFMIYISHLAARLTVTHDRLFDIS